MKAIIQKVKEASVTVDNEIVGSIHHGYLIFLGVKFDDTEKDAELIARKVNGLRIFEDDNGKMNLSIHDVDGEILVISQFTLYGNTKKGNRPSFTDAARPEQADKLYNVFIDKLQKLTGKKIETGRFQKHMDVSLINDGPITIEISSDHKK